MDRDRSHVPVEDPSGFAHPKYLLDEKEIQKFMNDDTDSVEVPDVIVRAAVRNRCWILVEGGPNGGLMLLKQAAEKCTERPVILVMDAFKRGRYSPFGD
eukprot:Skav219676  [mRNA]  locus=scaffold4838:65062:68284:- [translate_table: standard]